MRCWIALLACAGLLAAQQKSKKEVTQTLELFPELPAVIKADPARMTFHVSALTGKGLLSQQVREAIKSLWRLNKGATIVKMRAMVAGSGDMRRVQTIAAEMFSEKHLPLPVLTVVQIGLLPMEGAQVVIESISLVKKPVNPNGLAFVSGQRRSSPIDPDKADTGVTPMAVQSMAGLRSAVESVGSTSADVLRVTCFVSRLDSFSDLQRLFSKEFPASALDIVQAQRSPGEAMAACEAVARLSKAPQSAVEIRPATASGEFSQVALINAPQVALSGSQLGFRFQDSDVRLAFDRLKASLEQAGIRPRDVAVAHIYPLTAGIGERARVLQFEYFDKARPPAGTSVPLEGLPSLDASFAVDVIAVPASPK